MSGSPFFFCIRPTNASFSYPGKIPDLKEKLTRLQWYTASFSNSSKSKVFISNTLFRPKVLFIFLWWWKFVRQWQVLGHMLCRGKSKKKVFKVLEFRKPLNILSIFPKKIFFKSFTNGGGNFPLDEMLEFFFFLEKCSVDLKL